MTTRDMRRGTETIQMGRRNRSGTEDVVKSVVVVVVVVLCFIRASVAGADLSSTVTTRTISYKFSGTTEKAAGLSLLGSNDNSNDNTTTTLKPVRARITKVEPSYGPVSGGTKVSISGQDLDCRSDQFSLHLRLGDGHHNIDNRTEETNVITWSTPPSGNEQTGEFQLKVSCRTIDNTTLWETNDQIIFTYKPNPIVTSVSPTESILAGGVTQTVAGTNLDSVANPRMWTGFDRSSADQGEPCTIHNSTLMKCRAQRIDAQRIEGLSSNDSVRTHPEEINTDGKKVWIGFFFDGMTSFENFTRLRMFHDPEIEKFKPEPRDFLANANKPLSVGVTWPRMHFTADDIKVLIGIQTCTGAKMDKDSITCHPPSLPKSVIRYGPSELNTLKVIVRVGGQSRSDVGSIRYTQTESFHVVISVMIAVLAFIFLVSCVFGWCTFYGLQPSAFRRRAKKPPFQSIDADDFDPDAGTSHGANIPAFGKRRAKRNGADASERDKPIECVVMQYRGDGVDRP